MNQGEIKTLKDHFQKQFDDVLISNREDLHLIFNIIDRCARAESKAEDFEWARDGNQWGR